jgi:hypothetical protein
MRLAVGLRRAAGRRGAIGLRRAGSAAAAALLALGMLVAPGPLPVASPIAPVARAATDTRVTGSTTYALDPSAGAVHGTVELRLENTKPDTSVRRYYFTGYRVGIQKEAQDVTVTSGGHALKAKVSPVTDAQSGAAYLAVDVTFASRVYHDKSTAFRVRYDLIDSGPRSGGTIRVDPAIAAFYAWSYGPDGASVRVVVPEGFSPTAHGEALDRSAGADGSIVLAAKAVDDPAAWTAWITAERPTALTHRQLSVAINGSAEAIRVNAFPDDPAWLNAVSGRLEQALPILGGLVGLPWPVDGPLQVTEAYTPLLGGYAGFYDRSGGPGEADLIDVTEDPDPLVVVHEASHAWFNEDLLSGRWISEGLADEYASLALADLDQTGFDPESVSSADPVAFPLDRWPSPGRVNDAVSSAAERYGYNAAWTVIRSLVSEIGVARMRAVLAAAAARTIPYRGRPAPEARLRPGVPDWRTFLDLLEQVGGSSRAESLFRTWVVGPDELPLLDAHVAAVRAYGHLLADGRGWLPGLGVRGPLAAWDFPQATAAIADAERLLAERREVEAVARGLGLRPKSALQDAYESATGPLAAAHALAAEQLTALRAIGAARAEVDAARDPFHAVGLMGSQPEAKVQAATDAFEHDRLADARADAAAARSLVAAAPEIGRQRLLTGGGALLALLLLAGMLGLILRARRRRRRRRMATATLAAAPRPSGSGGSSTGTDAPRGGP